MKTKKNNKYKKCDSCGKEFTGKSFPVKNQYTFKIEKGLIQIERCYISELNCDT